MNLQIIDKATGEKLDLAMDKKMIESHIKSLPEEAKADMLMRSNYVAKFFKNVSDILKAHVKSLDLEFDDKQHAEWFNFRVTNAFRYSFDKARFEEIASEEEKEIMSKAKEIEQKYTKGTQFQIIK